MKVFNFLRNVLLGFCMLVIFPEKLPGYWRGLRATFHHEKEKAKWRMAAEAERLDRLRNPEKYQAQ